MEKNDAAWDQEVVVLKVKQEEELVAGSRHQATTVHAMEARRYLEVFVHVYVQLRHKELTMARWSSVVLRCTGSRRRSGGVLARVP
jgi:hypothetical protein